MTKNFEDIKVNDKIYLISVRESSLYEFPKGNVIRELKAGSIIRYPSNLYINLSDGITTISPRKNIPFYITNRDEDEIGLTIDVYGTTKRECAEAVVRAINERRTSLRAIERRCKESDASLDLSRLELNDLDLREEKPEPSLEEFASMALED